MAKDILRIADADKIDEKIPDMNTSWENYIGRRVEEFVKGELRKRFGYTEPSKERGEDDRFHLYSFASKEDCEEWKKDPVTNAALLLNDISIPEDAGGKSYLVGLYTDSPNLIVTTDNTVKINIRFTSEEYSPVTQTTEPTTEGGTLTVETRLNSSSSWTVRGTVENIPSIPATSTDEYHTVDISSMLSSGTQQVRLSVKGDTTGETTRFLQFTVTKTALALRFATLWERPVTDGVMRLSYYVSGAVAKTLHVRIDGIRTIERNIGASVYTETPLQLDVTDTDTEPAKVITHGVHEIEAWLSVNDSSIESEHLHSQVMVVADETDTSSYLILNDVRSKLTNWTAEQIFTYAVYNPADEPTPLKFILESYNGDKQFMVLDVGNVPSQARMALNNVIEIDSDLETIDAYMRFLSGDTAIHEVVGFEVDNSDNFAPVSSPDFVLNPRSRTNDETSPQTIINAAGGAVVPSVWSGFNMNTDGWVEDTEGQRCLRVPAGRSIDISYETLKDYIGTNNRYSLTIELDAVTRNAMKTDVPVVRMCSYRDDGEPQGFELRPQQAVFMTRDKRVRDDQDAPISEGRRTHIALNILYGINGTSQNYVRIFVKGIINREFEWSTQDEFVQYVDGVRTSQGIRIGSDSCDIDIYGMRIYHRAISASDVRKDYTASLPTVAEKIAFRDANDILDDSNQISYVKTREKYNTILITGQVPSYVTGNIKTKCDWDIHIVGDPAHSGTLNNMTTSGQGTSSRSYWDWNQQGKPNDDTDWVDENGVHHGPCYQLDDSVPAATKLVGKINWASSQQSHKMGSCNLFTDLWRRCTGGSSITNTPGFENARVSVKQKPFMLFTRPSADAEPVFTGLCTFGPGKGDKPTFGYDKKKFPDYLMIEGCDNGEPLTNHRIPWNDDITIGGDEDELIMFNGKKQWEIDMGNPDSLPYFRDAFNFIYLHSPHIRPFIGTLAQLQATTAAEADRQTMYWVTQASGSSARFDLYRYDDLTSQWVDAGVQKISTGVYERLNLAVQLGFTPTGNVWESINQQFINARVAEFKANAHLYFRLDDAFYHQMFCKLIGASDNRAKNTYMYLALHEGRLVIHFAQDDLDTIFLTDNVGRKNKPYYVEEHDRDAKGGTYWNGEANALYDLFELAFPTELRAMMKTMLSEMANLATDKTSLGCMEDYYFSIQRYFPAVAYNETARLRYETASAKWATGDYIASTHPITQSLGDQLEGELQWVKLRLIYLSSFASYGQFAMNGEGSLTFRSATMLSGAAPNYSFALTPHMWLYPAVSAGSSTLFGRGNAHPQRVKAGETFVLDGVAADNDTNIQVHGIHYMTSVGEFGDKSLSGTFTVSGERLTEFHASTQPMEFRPTAIEVTAPNLRLFDINGASTVGGSVNFTTQTRLEQVDLRGTSVSSFRIPEPSAITSLKLPATLTSLSLCGYKSLEDSGFEIEGVSAIQSLEFADCPKMSSQSIVSRVCAAVGGSLSECKVSGIAWKKFPLEHLMKLAAIKADLSGAIELDTTSSPTFEQKIALLEAFGNIDSTSNRLYVSYRRVLLTDIEVSYDYYLSDPGNYPLQITPNSPRANDFIKIEWSISANSCGATIDAKTGVLNVPRVGTEEEKPVATVTCKVTLSDGSTLTAQAEFGFYFRKCRVGDLVFHDGTYSDKNNKNKDVIGTCFYIDPKDETRRLMFASQDSLGSNAYGLYFNQSNDPTWAEGSENDINYNLRDIELADSPGYDVYDTPITNITSVGMPTSYLTDENYRDEYSEDGFKEIADNTAVGDIGFMKLTRNFTFRGRTFESGSWIPRGLYKTLLLIQHRDKVLQDSDVSLPVPVASAEETELQCLNRLLSDVVLDHDGATKYRQFYFPAASLCFAFQPTVRPGLVLADKFKANNWFLGANGDYCRCCWYHRQALIEDSPYALFREWAESGVIAPWRNAYHWSSTEFSRVSAWIVHFGNGLSSTISKYNSVAVRAVAAF